MVRSLESYFRPGDCKSNIINDEMVAIAMEEKLGWRDEGYGLGQVLMKVLVAMKVLAVGRLAAGRCGARIG